ncbi:MAG: cysteine--tRNA ligase [Elusimicrobia bacterium]|nr:cysteine--tRNA ligase [Elusimicrobiota bacterium]
MPIQLFNTLTRKKEDFTPLNPPQVGLYTCGPTVYNYAHIGNFRTYVFEDILRRSLEYLGFKVQHVMNVTDVGHLISDADTGEDKMEVGAKREGRTAWEIAEFYTQAFFRDAGKLNILPSHTIPRATQHIPEMIALIQALEKKGYTYRTSDGIYFDTSKFKEYAKLAGEKNIQGLKAGARVEASAEKKNLTDFSLWKFSPPGTKRQMEWDSPWGKGFPGWHIECSAMSMKYLGETFDIHCGGIDHISIHHTNEITQSEAATGKRFVRFWLHGDFLNMGAKMSKSKDGFVTVSSLEEKNFNPLAYRYFCLNAHYRVPLDFSWENLLAAQKSWEALKGHVLDWQKESVSGSRDVQREETARQKFLECIQDDLNYPQALAVLWEVVRGNFSASSKKELVLEFDKILGLSLDRPPESTSLNLEVQALVQKREEARKTKNFKAADQIRKQLEEKGVLLEDTPQGPRWKLKPKVRDEG